MTLVFIILTSFALVFLCLGLLSLRLAGSNLNLLRP